MVRYRALVLESRAQVVTAAEAALASPGQTLRDLEASVQQRLEENATARDRLRDYASYLDASRIFLKRETAPLRIAARHRARRLPGGPT